MSSDGQEVTAAAAAIGQKRNENSDVDFISCFLFTLLRIFISNIGKFQFIVVPLFFAFFLIVGCTAIPSFTHLHVS